MTDITELTPEAARESGSILIIVAARMARREFFTPLHALCESGQRVVSTRALCDAVERAEEHMVSQVSKIVDGHDRLTKKLKEAESRNAELIEALEKAQRKANIFDLFPDDYVITNGPMELIEKQAKRIAELEDAEQKLCAANVTLDARAELAERRLAEMESRTVTIEPFRSFVTDADLAALHRFAECCDDPESGGHDLDKEQVRRLEAIGALQRSGRISYITCFGDVLISITNGIKWETE
ncbi:hypothetical protein [Klebsiella sp. GN_Kp190]|uniref:hypothetical protein n=1 Tax=Klebsiella sp. GN_Kp190 TaxID=3153496 RepID=UPI0032B549F7